MRWLANLAVDADVAVQRAALRGLSRYEALPMSTLTALEAGARDARIARVNDGLLVSVLAPHAGRPEARSALQAALARAGDDAALRARIREILR